MTDKKYYTPTIEEFHVGFEFEALNSREWFFLEADFGWKYRVLNEYYLMTDFRIPNILLAIEKKWIRVKLLDREDIESLGWFYKQTTDSGLDYFWDDKTQKHSIIHSYITGWTVITVRDDARKEDYTSFAGYVKNKSELKRLMKQLGI